MDMAKVGAEKVGVDDDGGDGMQCSEHPFRSNPGGICAVCLQEKLGKLVSSSFPLPLRGSSSPSSVSPSFRSDSGVGSKGITACSIGGRGGGGGGAIRPMSVRVRSDGEYSRHCEEYHSRRVRIPFMLARRGKKMTAAESSSLDRSSIVFKRSKSTNTAPGKRSGNFPRKTTTGSYQEYNPSRRGFWSFLHLSKSKVEKTTISNEASPSTKKDIIVSGRGRSELHSMAEEDEDGDEDDDDTSPQSQATVSVSSFDRKVSRSRSVGCGSRSFSGDFFERISTGLGDCTLRRVESQREGKPMISTAGASMKERVRCGGIFGGFIIAATPSSYLVSSSGDEMGGKTAAGALAHGRVRSWGWAFASPMRAFTKPANSKDGRSSVSSILAVRS